MDTERSVEQQIQAEIELLRAQFPKTQDLYREACVVLFFRFGITPTANKLYQFVRKGSMSAPAEALAKFWDALREKSRVRIEHPDLPEDLRTAAGELTAVLWDKAKVQAQEKLATARNEAHATTLEAKSAQVTAEAERDQSRSAEAAMQASLISASETIRDLERQLSAEGATRAALERQLHQASQDIERLQVAIEEARREFAAELDKHRAVAQLAQERFQAVEERALREIDRERTQAAKFQKELDQVRVGASQAAGRHQAETSALHVEVGQLRQRVGVLEGNLQAAQSERDRLSAYADSLRQQITEATSQAAGYRVDADNWRRRTEEAQRAITDLQGKVVRRQRKTSAEPKVSKF